MHSQVHEGNSTRTPCSRYLVLVDNVAVHMIPVLLEVLSVLVIISCVEFQMTGELVAYVSSSGKLNTTVVESPGGIVTEHSQPAGQPERSGFDSLQMCIAS